MPHRRIEMPPSTPAYTGRGVYEQSYVGAGGERYLVAIDHRGRRVAEATLLPGISSPAAVTALLRQILDRVDPGYLRIIS